MAEEIFHRFHDMLTGDPKDTPDTANLGKLAVFSGVREFPMRVKCATLAWHTVRAALSEPGASGDHGVSATKRRPSVLQRLIGPALRTSAQDPAITYAVAETRLPASCTVPKAPFKAIGARRATPQTHPRQPPVWTCGPRSMEPLTSGPRDRWPRERSTTRKFP